MEKKTGPLCTSACMWGNPTLPSLASAVNLAFVAWPLLTAAAQQCRCYCDICSHVFGHPWERAKPTAAVEFMNSEKSSKTSKRGSVMQRTDHNVSVKLSFVTPNVQISLGLFCSCVICICMCSMKGRGDIFCRGKWGNLPTGCVSTHVQFSGWLVC